jgi:hypothetical protein
VIGGGSGELILYGFESLELIRARDWINGNNLNNCNMVDFKYLTATLLRPSSHLKWAVTSRII